MKKFFRGFTLAELLLCVGIIGIVSAMGMTIAKIGTDKAYNTFYYAGYINLYNAIADAKSQGKGTNVEIMNHARDLLSKDKLVANSSDDGIRFLTYKASADLNKLEEEDGCIIDGQPGIFKNGKCTPLGGPHCPLGYELVNGECKPTTIKMDDDPSYTTVCPEGYEKGGDGKCVKQCLIGYELVDGECVKKCPEGYEPTLAGACVPIIPDSESWSWPTSNDNVIETINGVKYYYPASLTDGTNGVEKLIGSSSGITKAIPITMTIPQRQTRTNNGIATVHLIYIDLKGGYLIPVTDDESVDLQNRRDLLPAYIDNGKVGRNSNVVNRANWTYERPAYRSYREAYCLLRGRTAINNVISCNGITANQNGVLAIANPQKAK